MIQKLVVLGFLKQRSASGYDIRKFIEKELGIFSQLETKSIYYPLSKMEAQGLVKKRSFSSKTHLKKYIYSITPQGEREFFRLAKEALLSQRRPFIELDIALYFLSFLDKSKILPLLRLRARFLNNVQKWLVDKEKELKDAPKHLSLLLRHHLKLVEAEIAFIKEMKTSLKDELQNS